MLFFLFYYSYLVLLVAKILKKKYLIYNKIYEKSIITHINFHSCFIL
jgi:hypothetical protein